MFTNSKDLKGLVIRATDGEIGEVQQLYFDDQSWTVRYLVVDTGRMAQRTSGFDLADVYRRSRLAVEADGRRSYEKPGGARSRCRSS